MKIAVMSLDLLLLDRVKRAVAKSGGLEEIWSASSQEEALRLYRACPPDLLFLDVARIGDPDLVSKFLSCGFSFIVLLAKERRQLDHKLFRALEQGAWDVLLLSLESTEERLLEKRIEALKRLFERKKGELTRKEKKNRPLLIILGASTGGPGAVARVLSALPLNLPASTVVIQHVQRDFVSGLVEWFKLQSGQPVELIETETLLSPGKVYFAPSGKQLLLNRNLTLSLEERAVEWGYVPSIDSFCTSVAEHWPYPCIAALLTGMGSDGAEGLKALKERGHYTLAEQESSCMIYGMPKVAIELGAASEVAPIQQIGEKILQRIKLLYE